MNDHSPHDHDHAHTHEPPDYTGWINGQRAGKDDYFKQSPRSPIPQAERSAFSGLAYYAIDEALRFEDIALGPLPEGTELKTQVQTSDGAIRDGERVGTFRFLVEGIEQQLFALQLAGSHGDALFVPFKDTTNGPETYGAGRYLDLEPFDDGTYELDFNLAYAPFCAYSPSYSCPLPPRENWLTARISAGERNPFT
jgi:uncharacterized protein (DUF1684 family)